MDKGSRGWTNQQWQDYYNSDEYRQWRQMQEEKRAAFEIHLAECRRTEQPLAEALVKQAVDNPKAVGSGLVQNAWWVEYEGYEYELVLQRQEPRKPLP